MAKKNEINQDDEKVVLKSPFRKTIYGFCTLAFATILYYTWFVIRGGSPLVDNALIIVSTLLALLGVYRITTIDVTMLRKGEKSFLRRTYHFGFFRRDTAFTFDHLELLPRDIYFGMWSIRAYLSEEHLAGLSITDSDRASLGEGSIVIDGFSHKDAHNLRAQLEEFSGVERKPKKKEKKDGLL